MAVQIRVRGYHLDVYQHVNNGRYMEFIEEARWAFMDETGFADKI
ncbi:MAG: thioesterase family protein, partial [Thalassolituus sp.]